MESRESKKEEVKEIGTNKPKKLEYLIALITIFLTFFINEFYKVGFRWDSIGCPDYWDNNTSISSFNNSGTQYLIGGLMTEPLIMINKAHIQ